MVIAGPSGSGKSTLALALAGLIPHRIGGDLRGSITWQADGSAPVDLTALPLHEAAQHVGIAFQNPEYQLIQYRVDAEVAFGPENLGLPHEEVVARVWEALRTVGAWPLAESAITSLSGGQKQRVAIAAALAMAPPLLVLDEPTSDLDPVGTDEVLRVLRGLCRDHGRGVVLVEHKLDEVAPYADRVVLVEDGQVIIDGPPRRAFASAARWRKARVRPPELAVLGERMPARFPDGVPLTVDEAAAGLADMAGAAGLPLTGTAGLPAGAGISGSPPKRAACPAATGSTATGSTATGSTALELAEVSVSFREKQALRGVSVRVEEGEWLAVIGANGSGKTTLGSVLMGFIAPDGGTARCFGRPVEPKRIPRQAERVGYLFQNVDDMLFSDTVAAELEFTRRHRVPAPPDAPSPSAVAGLIGLGEAHATALFDLLTRVRATLGSLTCVLITHDMRLVARFADRVIALRQGEIVLDAPPRRAFSEPELLESCGVRAPAIAQLHTRLAGHPPEVAVSADEFAALITGAQQPVTDSKRPGGRHVEHA